MVLGEQSKLLSSVTYVNLIRIKAHETRENKEFD